MSPSDKANNQVSTKSCNEESGSLAKPPVVRASCFFPQEHDRDHSHMSSEYIKPDSKTLLVFCEATKSPSFVCSGCGSSDTLEFPCDVFGFISQCIDTTQ